MTDIPDFVPPEMAEAERLKEKSRATLIEHVGGMRDLAVWLRDEGHAGQAGQVDANADWMHSFLLFVDSHSYTTEMFVSQRDAIVADFERTMSEIAAAGLVPPAP